MFERFARETKEVVRRAAEIAEAEGAAVVQAEHLLLALVDPVRDPVGTALVDAGVTPEAIRSARDREFRSALATVGIDTRRPVPPPTVRLRRGRTTRFAPSAKLAVERTLTVALEEGARGIDNRHLLGAIVRADVGRTPRLLAELGTTPRDLLRRLGM
jgi:ATP-dependent Clp protease ATP-binding subunit ClpA